MTRRFRYMTTDPKKKLYPEVRAGGYSRRDGIVEFYGRVNALLTPEMIVLDYGAGRGRGNQEDQVLWRKNLRILRGKCKKVIGVDVDPAINENPGLDEARLLEEDGAIPLPAASVDLIISDAVFEHLSNVEVVVSELSRVLKKGGWICARTPNRFGYIGIGVNMVPNKLHVALLRYLQPQRKPEDVFPTVYSLNTRRALLSKFPKSDWLHASYGHYGEPAYFGTSIIAWWFVSLMQRITPRWFAPMLLIFVQKK